MVSVLNSGLSGPGSSPGQGHCVVFLGKTLYSHSASLHPGLQMSTNKYDGGNPAMDQHPIQGGVAILLAASCQGKLECWPHWPLGPVQRLIQTGLNINKGTHVSRGAHIRCGQKNSPNLFAIIACSKLIKQICFFVDTIRAFIIPFQILLNQASGM